MPGKKENKNASRSNLVYTREEEACALRNRQPIEAGTPS